MSCGRSLLDKEEVSKIIENDFSGRECEILEFELNPVGGDPAGFLGEHKRLRVEFRLGKKVMSKTYFVKNIPENLPAQREYVKQLRYFFKETGIYTKVFPVLDEAAALVPRWHPICYFSRGEELLVFQDLIQNGYYMYPQRQFMDEEHVLLSLETLASMHASSIIYEDQLPKENGSSTIPEVFPLYFSATSFEKNDQEKRARETAIAALIKIVNLLEGYTEEQKELIKRELPSRMRRYFTMGKPSIKYKNVITHGDFWANNILFRKDENGTKVQNAVIVDFQLCRYAPPAQDIVTFLHLVQTKRFRDENLLRLLKHYFESLSSCLAKHRKKTENYLSWYELLGTYDFYEELGPVTALFFFQLILTPPSFTKKFLSSSDEFFRFATVDRSEMVIDCFLNDSSYKERFTEAMNILITDYIL